MTETTASTDQIRAITQEALERVRKASDDYFVLLEKGLASSPLPAAAQARQFCGFMQNNVTATFALGSRLVEAKDVQDAVKIQSEFFQQQMKTLTDQARNMGEAAVRAATSVFPAKS
jgi:phasin